MGYVGRNCTKNLFKWTIRDAVSVALANLRTRISCIMDLFFWQIYRVLMKIVDKFSMNHKSEVHDLNQKTRCKMICNFPTVSLHGASCLLIQVIVTESQREHAVAILARLTQKLELIGYCFQCTYQKYYNVISIIFIVSIFITWIVCISSMPGSLAVTINQSYQ